MIEVRHLSVMVTLWVVVTSRVNICLKDSELLSRSCVDNIVNKEPVCVALNPCGRVARCRCRWNWIESNVRTVASCVQVLELPVVLNIIAGADVRRRCLEAAICSG